MPSPCRANSGRSALDELRAHRGAGLLRGLREALTLAGIQALAGARAALACALALAGVAGHALAGRGVGRRRPGRYDRAGEEQSGSGGCERRTGFGIQLHGDLLDDCLTTILRRELAMTLGSPMHTLR